MQNLVDGRLDACLFLSRKTTSLPPSEMLAELLGAPIEPEERMCLLSGRRPGDAVIGDAGRTVCACFGVGLNILRDTIVEQRLTNVAEIGAALNAGTNCGSCMPELKAILRDARIGSAGVP